MTTQYNYGTGRRKSAVARVFIKPGKGEIIINNKPIDVYGNGLPERDFTYIDDIVEGIIKLLPLASETDSNIKYRLLNIGNNNPVTLDFFIKTLEEILEKKAIRNEIPMQPGDVQKTFADISAIYTLLNFKPKTDLRKGLESFWNWYKAYSKIL